MKKLTSSFLLFCITITCTIFASAQESAMTNAEVISLSKAGISSSLIISKIRTAKTDFDLSTNSMIALKKAGISEEIIVAMLDAKGGTPRYSDSQPPAKEVRESSVPANESDKALRQISEPGIYLFADGKMSLIEPTVFSGTKMNPLAGMMTYGIKKTKMRAKVRGKAANMQVSAAQLVFYFVFNPDNKNSGATMAGSMWWGLPATSPAEFMLVQMSIKDASREAVMGEYGTFSGMSSGARDKDIRDYSFEKVRSGIYRVAPKTTLTAGEYCFYYAAVVGGFGIAGGKIFDFGISK